MSVNLSRLGQQRLVPLVPILQAELGASRDVKGDVLVGRPPDCNPNWANEYVDFYVDKKLTQKKFQQLLVKAGHIPRDARDHIMGQWELFQQLKEMAGYKDVVVVIRGIKYARVRGPQGRFVGELSLTKEGLLSAAAKKQLVPVTVLMDRALAKMLKKEAIIERKMAARALQRIERERRERHRREVRVRAAIKKGFRI